MKTPKLDQLNAALSEHQLSVMATPEHPDSYAFEIHYRGDFLTLLACGLERKFSNNEDITDYDADFVYDFEEINLLATIILHSKEQNSTIPQDLVERLKLAIQEGKEITLA